MQNANARATAAVDALFPTLSAAQKQRISAAFAASLPPTATQAQKSEMFVRALRQVVIDTTQTHEDRQRPAVADEFAETQ